MKSILIPSLLNEDTVFALELAIRMEPEGVVLLFLHDLPADGSALAALRSMNPYCTAEQKKILELCRTLASGNNVPLSVHNQYGISMPLLRHLLEHLEAGSAIIPPSVAASGKRTHTQFLKLLGGAGPKIITGPTQPLQMKRIKQTEMKKEAIVNH